MSFEPMKAFAATGHLLALTGMFSVLFFSVFEARAQSSEVFDVADYGACPDDAVDDGPAIRDAIAAAKAHTGPAVVRFQAGEYHIAPASGQRTALPVENVKDLVLEGRGKNTRLIITDPTADAVRFTECEDVGIAELAIDYDPPPFTQGTVLDVAGQLSFVLRLDAGYLVPDDAPFRAAPSPWGLVVREVPGGGEQFGPIPLFGGMWHDEGGGLWRCVLTDPKAIGAAGIRAGSRFIYMARTVCSSGVAAWSCVGVRLTNVTVHAAPSLATLWGLNKNVVIDGLRVERPAGSGRLISTNADGIHCLGNRGTLRIENCSFEAMADDAVNIHARGGIILGQPAPNQLLVNEGGTVQHRIGDHLQLYDPEAGRIRAQPLIITDVVRDQTGALLTLDRDVKTVVTGSNPQESDHLFDLDACGAGAVIRNNTFGYHRGRSVLLKTTDCLVEGNTFRNREGWGVSIQQLQGWSEGPAAQRVTIRGNSFQGSRQAGWSPSILIRPTTRSGAPAQGRPVRDIRVENNKFVNPSNGILSAWSVDGLEFANNQVQAGAGTRVASGPLVSLNTGTGFVFNGLKVSDASGQTTAVVEAQATVEHGPPGLTVENVEILEGDFPILIDHREQVTSKSPARGGSVHAPTTTPL